MQTPEWTRLLIGALCLAGAGALLSGWFSRRDTQALRELRAWIALLRQMREQIAVFGRPLDEILRAFRPGQLAACGYGWDQPPQDLIELLAGCTGAAWLEALEGDARQELDRFAAALGRGYREEQLRLCDSAIGRFAEREREWARVLPDKRRRRLVVCACLGLSVAILLL